MLLAQVTQGGLNQVGRTKL